MFSRSAIQTSGIVVCDRNSQAKATFLGSPRFHLLHHFQPFFGMPHSPNNRSTRSHSGRRDGAPKYCG